MNVVGKVGSLISKGVYSVATPFHPFGGAVDIIVVQQQDGSFRSTPWYVRFGKFQGVLKGAEKIVLINVNGTEANFHMYLDNSGEAYFVREVDSGQGGEINGLLKDGREGTQEDSIVNNDKRDGVNNGYLETHRLHSTMSDPGVAIENYSSFGPDRLDRAGSDACKFYDFQEETSSFEDSVELMSEYGSTRFENLDVVENFEEPQGSNSEMVLVSIDGHILTAPISSAEHNIENVELDTPQFHLGPGESTEFVEGSGGFCIGEKVWAAGYLNDLEASSSKVDPVDVCFVDNNSESIENQLHDYEDGKDVNHDLEASGVRQLDAGKEDEGNGYPYQGTDAVHQLLVCKEVVEHVREDQLTDDVANEERDLHIQSDVEDASFGIYHEDRFSSCLQLLDLTMDAADDNMQSNNSSLEVVAEVLQDKSSEVLLASNGTVSEYSLEKHKLNVKAVNEAGCSGPDEAKTDDGLAASTSGSLAPLIIEEVQCQKKVVGVDVTNSGCISVSIDQEDKHEHTVRMTMPDEISSSNLERDAPEDECSRSKIVEQQSTSSSEEMQPNPGLRCEISLCGHLLSPGMGLSTAAEAFDAHRISQEEYKHSMISIIKNENLVVRFKDRYLPWDKAASIILGLAAFNLDLPVEDKDVILVEKEEPQKLEDDDSGSASTPGRKWRLWPIPFRRSKVLEHSSTNVSNEEAFVDSESVPQNPSAEPTLTSQTSTPSSGTGSKSPHKKMLRINIPTSEQIASLNLKEGQNMVTFNFSTRVLGMQQVDAHIYLWKWNARIVISDVDGTITKSDVLGQFMPLVGKDWTQSGVARLFSAIKENGYQLLFLSARAIVQAYLTRSFLLNLKQDGKTLPNGPIVISPDGLFPSLYREVIRRAPHEFKIACLEDIKALFPPDYNPFYAGFGNRDTDELSYRKIGIPKGKIFIINPKGEVAINSRIDAKSYTSLHTLVNDMFPPTLMIEQEDYNSWNYWRVPLPDIDE
ncbi:hypothetical protein Nepgr_011959 [Nepenthes gracilis]|uniref:phosphatidate phosphatase n=1 Tax=Nepenthes gracilis TaxID=150966 RepID=A0AAD3SF98_NEPGR|nr:hypothetical protein Nepgr_011959 [Nepenthes gracilis]